MNILRKKILFTLTIFFILAIIIVVNISYILPIKINKQWSQLPKTPEEAAVFSFISNSMSEKNYGIYTNYLDVQSVGDIAKGHTVLSESEGLLMLYAVEKGDKTLFDEHYNIVVNQMLLKDGLVSWKKDKKNIALCSSSIDDLRITKSMLYAYDRWKDFKYKKQAVKLSKSMLKNSIDENILIDFKDQYGKSKNTTICYLDLQTMKLLSELDFRWKKVYSNCDKLLNNAYISSELPLYRKSYSVDKRTYTNEDSADMLLSMLTIQNKLQAGEDVSTSVSWIKEKFNKNGALYSSYAIKSGEAASNVESTAIYSVGAVIARELKDEELYSKMINKVKSFQIKEEGELKGAFGNQDTQEVFSFDNLNALLALQNRQ